MSDALPQQSDLKGFSANALEFRMHVSMHTPAPVEDIKSTRADGFSLPALSVLHISINNLSLLHTHFCLTVSTGRSRVIFVSL